MKVIVPKADVIAAHKNGIQCKLGGQYTLRKIISGDATIGEGDDVVTYIKGNIDPVSNCVTLITGRQLEVARRIFYVHQRGHPDLKLAIDLPTRPSTPIDFATYVEAESFLN